MDSCTYISLYTGLGGLDLGFRLAVPTARAVCYVERDAEACALLVDHMQAGLLDDAPVWTDSGTFDGRTWRGKVDFITGGFPCQPWSVAGQRAGTADERWLWPHIQRTIRDVEPSGVFLENVPGLLHGGVEHVLGDLAALGFDAEWAGVRASDVGAPHRRERIFILGILGGAKPLAYREIGRISEPELDDTESRRSLKQPADIRATAGHGDESRHTGGAELAHTGHDAGGSELGQQHREQDAGTREPGEGMAGRSMGDAYGQGLQGWDGPQRERTYERPAWPPGPAGDWSDVPERYWPATEPEVRGMADGLTHGLARTAQLRLLGNGVVPQQAAAALTELIERIQQPGAKHNET